MYFMWYDDTPTKSVTDKIGDALEKYRARYGHNPTYCLYHLAGATGTPTATGNKSAGSTGISPLPVPTKVAVLELRLVPSPQVPVNYFWMGSDAA